MELVNVDELRKRPHKCECGCGNDYSNHEEIIQISANGFAGDGHFLYAHYDCIKPTFYGCEERENIGGDVNTTYEKTPRISSEIEIFNEEINEAGIQTDRQEKAMQVMLSGDCPELTDLYLRLALFGCKHNDSPLQQIGLDSSTALEGHISELSIEGSSKLFRNLTDKQIELLNNDANGHHLHVETRTDADLKTKEIAFGMVLTKIKQMGAGYRKHYFGSDFRFYANSYVGEKHTRIDENGRAFYHRGCGWIDSDGNEYSDVWDLRSVYPCICFHTYTTELRLARFSNADQYVKLMKVWRAVVKEFNAGYGTMDAYKLGKKMSRALNFNLAIYQKGR